MGRIRSFVLIPACRRRRGRAVLPTAGRLNSWLAAPGLALSAVYAIGVMARPQRCHARLGLESILALVLFTAGIAGLFVLPH